MSAIITLSFGGGERRMSYTPPALLSDLLAALGEPIDMPCGGRGRCGKCRVVASGHLSALTDVERTHLSPAEIDSGARYACQALALGDVRVTLPRSGAQQVLTAFNMPGLNLSPWYDGYGMAVDIGTTTVAAYLFAPGTAMPCAVASSSNPQSSFGADVISRLEKSLAGQGAALREAIARCLAHLTEELCVRSGINRGAIGAAVLTGNTAMLYLLTGRDPSSITAAPFEADTLFGEMIPSESLGLRREAKIYLPRCVSAYVGADITCAMLSSGLFANGRVPDVAPTLLCDIGTNGEMVLLCRGKLYGCSTAAGPAFEGAGITMGMNARPGAIRRVWCSAGTISFETIGGQSAQGLCGTGIVDAVGALLDAGLIDETGRMEAEYYSFAGTSVRLTRQDVRQVQLAKAAICAGMLTLVREAGISPAEVDRLLIAGGFGNCIDPVSAERIGLIPEGFARKATAIGNAAGAGAAMTLLSARAKTDGAEAARICQVVELSTNRYFMEQYIEQMSFE